MIAYNQEAYIRDAVKSALSQDYRPLEIILSDDSSSDRTFDIISEEVNHCSADNNLRLRVLRNEKNLGLTEHVNRVIQAATSPCIVVAAGDDISLPNRVSEIAKIIAKNPSVFAVVSNYLTIPDYARQAYSTELRSRYLSLAEIIAEGGGIYPGAAYAYRKDVFEVPFRLGINSICEDKVLPFRASLLGQVYYTSMPLVRYRILESGLGTQYSLGLPARHNKEHVLALLAELKEVFRLRKTSLPRYVFALILLHLLKNSISPTTIRPVAWLVQKASVFSLRAVRKISYRCSCMTSTART